MTVLYISLSSAILDLLMGKREKVYIATFKTVALSRQGGGNFMGFQMYAR